MMTGQCTITTKSIIKLKKMLFFHILNQGVIKANTSGAHEEQNPNKLGALICTFYLLVHN